MNNISTKHENGALSQNRLSQSQSFKPSFSMMGLPNSAFAAKSRFLALALGIILLIWGNTAHAQEAQNASYPNQAYTFSAQSGTFSYLTGGTAVTAIQADDTYSAALPIGFTFRFGCEDYTRVIAGSNGTLEFSASGVFGATNAALTGTQIGLAPLWDDLNGAVGTATYATTGTAPNRVFTMEWKNWKWYYNTTAASISFQVRLYEGSNTVEYQYKQEAGALNTPSASIGFYNGSLGIAASAKQMWLQDVTATPATSATISATIATKPLDGQIYRFVNNNNCSGICTGQTLLNGTGGTTTTDGLQIQVSGAGNIQIYKQGVQQVYNAQITAGTTNPFGVPGTTHGVAMNIGTSVFKSGSLGSGASAANFTILYNTCQNAIGAVGGTQRDTIILRAVKNSLNYDLKLIYTYTYPNTFMNIQYLVTIPAGNTEVVKVTQGWDTFLAGGDAGPGFIQGTTPNLTMGVAKLPSYEAFQYVSGVPWSSYYSAVYSSINSSMAAANNFSLTNVIDPTATTDNGIAIQVDYGSTAGSFQSSNNVIFACGAGTTAPTVSSTTKTNTCPSNTADLTTLVTSTPPAGTVIYWTDATGAALATPNSVSTSGTYYVAYKDLSSGCTSPATTINYSIISCTDTDGDGIVDAIDIDDDNDGVLDVTECSDNRVSNGVFPTTGGNTNTVTGWTVGGTYAASGSWISPTGRVNLGAGGLTFQRDFSTVSNIFQPLTNVTGGSRIVISNIIWLNTATNLSDGTAILEIKYAGTTYATINTGVGLPSTPTITASNGAIVSVGTLPTLSTTGAFSTATNLTISLPSSIPVSGNLELNFIAASHATQVDDIAMTAIAMYGCQNTDLSGAPDYLDLDSDGDGCPDAYEAGATTIKTTNYQFTGAVGTNGLVNSLETVADNGVVNYTSTYTAYALNGALNKCNLVYPGCVATIKHWLKADGSIYKDAGLTLAAQGDKVQQWNDAIGNFHVVQATAANKPTYTPNTLTNFNPSVTFARASTNWMQVDAPFMARNRGTMYAVGTPTTVGINNTLAGFDPTGNHPSLSFASDNRFFFYPSGTFAYAPQTAVLNQPFVIGSTWDNGTGLSGANTLNLRFNGNNTLINAAGTTNVNTSAAYDKYRIGGDTDWGSFDGPMNEFLVFETPLTAAERDRVDTYLGIKYGITLAHDYVLGDGTTTAWDKTANATYHNNVFGIGRDDCQGLNQKQSTSANVGFQPILSTTGFAATNTANATNFTADKSFLTAGSDAGAASFGTTITAPSGANANNRFTRIWKVQETGTVSTVKFAVPQVGQGNTVYLIRSTNTTFDATDTWIPLSNLTVGGTNYLAGDVDFANGDYFTIATYLTAPGGVAADLSVWLNASNGAGSTDGIGVSTWADNSPLGYDLVQATAANQPTLYTTTASKLVNFNPSVYFDGTNDMILNATRIFPTTSPYSFMGVEMDERTTNVYQCVFSAANTFDRFSLHKQGGATGDNGFNMYRQGVNRIGNGNGFAPASGSNGAYNGTNFTANVGTQPQIFGLTSINTIANSPLVSYIDGYKQTTNPTGSAQTEWFGKFSVGNYDANNYPFLGHIPEIMAYSRQLTDVEAQKVNTYLAIKYGVTLGQGGALANINANAANYDYVATDGTVIWNTTTNATYRNHIFGIGRDDTEGLNQKQSKSVNAGLQPIIATTGFATTNAGNATGFTADKSYEIIGADAGATSFGVAITAPTGITANNRFTRIWKVQETGTVGTVKFAIDPIGTGGTVYLVRSTNTTFDATDTWTPLSNLTVGGTNYLAADIDFNNGDYFTIATFLAGPGGVVDVDFWIKSDDAGTIGTAWKDHSKNGNPIEAVGTWSLSAADAAHNFYPYTTGFSTTKYFRDVNTSLTADNTYGTNTRTPFAVFSAVKPNGATGRIVGIDNDDLFAAEPGFSIVNNKPYFYKYWETTISYTHTTAINNGENSVLSYNATQTAANAGTMQIGKDGAYQNFNLTGYWHNLGKFLEVGYGTWDVNAPFPGDIMEVAWYKRNLTANEQDRVNSYLGIKNGVTLSIDYLASNGSVIWNRTASTGFNNNIFGIGRDDASVLYQKQAKSANATAKMTIGLADSISTSNATHPSVFSDDALFILIGDNGLAGVVTPSVSGACPPPPSADKASAQKFKVVETGAVQSIKVLFNPSGLGFNNAFAVYMQVASDSSFTSLIANVPMNWSGANVQTNYNFASNATSYVRFMGNTTSLANLCTANGSKTFYFNGWNYGTKTKDIVANYAATANAGDLVMKTTVTDGTPNVLLYRPNVDWYPVYDGYGLFFPRWGSSANENSTMTTKIAFLSQATTGAANASTTKLAAATASFMIWDLDGYIGSRDIVKVYGKLGSAVIDAKLTRNQYTALSLNYGGDPQSVIGGTAPWDLSYYGRLYVNFETPVEEIYIEYKQDATYAFNSYQDFRVGPITATCKAPTPKVVTPDNVYIYKEVASPIKSGDVATYKFTIQNLNCGDKTINFSDILPSGSGLIWADSSLSTPLSIGTKNAYGNSQTLTLTNVTVPAGTSYLFIDTKTATVGTFNNQATFTVGANSYTTDDPTASGAGNQPTALNVIANDPDANLTVAKTVNKTTAGQNDVLTYTYVITNPNGTAINATFDDQIPADASGNTVSFVASSLTGAGAALVSPYATTASLTIRNLSIPANGSTTLTIQANTGSFVLGDTIKNVASVVPDVSAGYRLTNRNSGSANTKIQVNCVAGSVAPSVSATTLSNGCPTTTANLSTITASNLPVGTKLTWHTATPATFANKVTDSTAVATAGTYYAAIYDFTNDCIAGSGAATTAVTVTITSPCPATFTFNCGSATATGTFVANATGGQTGSVSVPMTGATAGSATFNVSGTGFTGTLSTTLTAGQTSVSVPITYDGTGTAGARPLSITSSQGTGTCSTNATVTAQIATFTFNCGSASATGTFVANGTAGQTGSVTVPMTNATAGSATFNVSGTGFTGTLTTTLTANQASVSVPITYDGTGTAGTRPLSITSSQGTGTCSTNATVSANAGSFAFDCSGGILTVGSFVANGVGGQNGSLTIPMTSATAGPATFTVTGAGFTGTLSTTLVANQATVSVPITYDGTGAARSQALTIASSQGSGSCSTTATVTAPIATFTFNCGSATSTGTFTSNGTAGQTGSLTIQMTGATAGSASFTVTGTGFTGSLSTTLTAGQASVTIPITYDGTGAVGSRTLTVTSSQGTGACTPSVNVNGVPDLTTTIGQPSPVLTVGQPSDLPITVSNIGNGAAPGIIATTITLPTGVTAPAMFTSTGWTCNTTAPSVICTNLGPIAAGGNSTFNVPVTPDVTTVGTKPIFNATTNPVTGETNTTNNPATPLVPTVNVLPANCDWTPGTIGK